jgi:redox-sensitive bicupin YhaK (pirin superfamily)
VRVIRRDSEIHDVSGGWFRARWHFSFDDYQDRENDSFGAMRVFNDDRLVPGAIWPLHPHRDVEGLTYVVEGLFGHEDNVGGAFGPLPAGSVQRMTLGSGAWHSEQNASKEEGMRFIQIWILPDEGGLEPGVEQRVFTKRDRTNRLLRAFAPISEIGEEPAARQEDGEPNPVEAIAEMWEGDGRPVGIHQDASVYVSALDPDTQVEHELGEGRGAYLYVIAGRLGLHVGEGNDPDELSTGDAAKITDEPRLSIKALAESELILVDVPMRFTPVGVWAGRA